jgi:DNA polymerase III alpha subunit
MDYMDWGFEPSVFHGVSIAIILILFTMMCLSFTTSILHDRYREDLTAQVRKMNAIMGEMRVYMDRQLKKNKQECLCELNEVEMALRRDIQFMIQENVDYINTHFDTMEEIFAHIRRIDKSDPDELK